MGIGKVWGGNCNFLVQTAVTPYFDVVDQILSYLWIHQDRFINHIISYQFALPQYISISIGLSFGRGE